VGEAQDLEAERSQFEIAIAVFLEGGTSAVVPVMDRLVG
jgi:hypothetical protein